MGKAWKVSLLCRHRPWDMVLVIYGFPTKVLSSLRSSICYTAFDDSLNDLTNLFLRRYSFGPKQAVASILLTPSNNNKNKQIIRKIWVSGSSLLAVSSACYCRCKHCSLSGPGSILWIPLLFGTSTNEWAKLRCRVLRARSDILSANTMSSPNSQVKLYFISLTPLPDMTICRNVLDILVLVPRAPLSNPQQLSRYKGSSVDQTTCTYNASLQLYAWSRHRSATELGRIGYFVQVRLMMEMLNVKPWCFFPLTLQILSSEYEGFQAKGPPLPSHIQVTTAPLEVSPRHSLAHSQGCVPYLLCLLAIVRTPRSCTVVFS